MTQTGNIAIGTNNAVLSGTNQIFIGASNKSTNISGNTTMLGDLNVSSGIINASNFKMYSTKSEVNQSVWLDTIGGTLNQEFIIGYNNASHLYLGGPNSTFIQIGGDKGIVSIANGALSATGKVNIATGGNVAGSEINIGGGSSSIRINRPLTPNYPISFTSGQIGYSSSSTVSGTFVRGTYNTVIAPALTGVYMSVALSSIYGTTYYGINNYDLQVGLNGVGVKVRNSLDGANLTLQVYTQTVPYVYSSGGTENPASAGLYTSLYVYFSSTTSTAYYSTTLYYTRVA